MQEESTFIILSELLNNTDYRILSGNYCIKNLVIGILTLECIFRGQKFTHLFSMPTPELNEWTNFLKKVIHPKTPEHQGRYL